MNYFKRKDLFLVMIIIMIVVIFLCLKSFININGNYVEISIDGKVYDTYSLNNNIEEIIKSDYGYNVLVIKNKQVFIKDADCENHTCMKEGKIKNGGEMLICLPHKLVVKIVEKEQEDGISF